MSDKSGRAPRGGHTEPNPAIRGGTVLYSQTGKRLPGEWNASTQTPMGDWRNVQMPPQRDPYLQTPQDRARITQEQMDQEAARNGTGTPQLQQRNSEGVVPSQAHPSQGFVNQATGRTQAAPTNDEQANLKNGFNSDGTMPADDQQPALIRNGKVVPQPSAGNPTTRAILAKHAQIAAAARDDNASQIAGFDTKPQFTTWTGPSTDYKPGPGSGERVAVRLPGANAVDAAGPRPPAGTQAAVNWMDRVQKINGGIAAPHDVMPDGSVSNGGTIATPQTEFQPDARVAALGASGKQGMTPYGPIRATMPTPIPTPVSQWQSVIDKRNQVVKDHPNIGIAGTPENEDFIARHNEEPGRDLRDVANDSAAGLAWNAIRSSPAGPLRVPPAPSQATTPAAPASSPAASPAPASSQPIPSNPAAPAPGNERLWDAVGGGLKSAWNWMNTEHGGRGDWQNHDANGKPIQAGSTGKYADPSLYGAAPATSPASAAPDWTRPSGRPDGPQQDTAMRTMPAPESLDAKYESAMPYPQGDWRNPPPGQTRPSGRPDGPQPVTPASTPNGPPAPFTPGGIGSQTAPGQMTAGITPQMTPSHMPSTAADPDSALKQATAGGQMGGNTTPWMTPTHMDQSQFQPQMTPTHMPDNTVQPTMPVDWGKVQSTNQITGPDSTTPASSGNPDLDEFTRKMQALRTNGAAGGDGTTQSPAAQTQDLA